jgi:hypothetical protein
MSAREIARAASQATAKLGRPFRVEVESVSLGGWPSNLLLIGRLER